MIFSVGTFTFLTKPHGSSVKWLSSYGGASVVANTIFPQLRLLLSLLAVNQLSPSRTSTVMVHINYFSLLAAVDTLGSSWQNLSSKKIFF